MPEQSVHHQESTEPDQQTLYSKIKGEMKHAMIIPAGVAMDVPEYLKDRTVYVENDCLDIWDWSEKVYQTIEKRNHKCG